MHPGAPDELDAEMTKYGLPTYSEILGKVSELERVYDEDPMGHPSQYESLQEWFEKIPDGAECEVESSFDGDTMSYQLTVNGKPHSMHWSTNDAIKEVKKSGAKNVVWKNGQPGLSHIERGSVGEAKERKPNVHIRQGDGFWYAVPTSETHRTVERAKSRAALRNKLVRQGYAIIPESLAAKGVVAALIESSARPGVNALAKKLRELDQEIEEIETMARPFDDLDGPTRARLNSLRAQADEVNDELDAARRGVRESADKVPDVLRFWSVDTVAECVPGLTRETYAELWQLLDKAVAAGTAKPVGGDGSNGTTEEPIVSSGEYGSDLVAAWPHLSAAARENICKAAAKLDDEDTADL